MLRIHSIMCFVFNRPIHVYFKVSLHVFHAQAYEKWPVSGRLVLLFNKLIDIARYQKLACNIKCCIL